MIVHLFESLEAEELNDVSGVFKDVVTGRVSIKGHLRQVPLSVRREGHAYVWRWSNQRFSMSLSFGIDEAYLVEKVIVFASLRRILLLAFALLVILLEVLFELVLMNHAKQSEHPSQAK